MIGQDIVSYRLVLASLAVVSILGMLGGIGLALVGREMPAGLYTVLGSAVGALVGLLAPMPRVVSSPSLDVGPVPRSG